MGNLYISQTLFSRYKLTCFKIRFVLGLLLVFGFTGAYGQAPVISYSSPQVYPVEAAISPLSPTNTGGPVSSTPVTLASGFGDFRGVAIDHWGNIYVADVTNSQVVKIPAGTSTHVVIGSGFYNPTGVAVDAAGNVYVADFNNNAVKEIPVDGSAVLTLGSGFSNPFGVAIDAAGNLYVSDFSANVIKEIPSGNGPVVTIATGFNKPTGIAVDASGNIYLTDRGNNAIKRIAAGTSSAVTLASASGNPNGVAVDAAGNVYFADGNNTTLIEIPAGGGSNIAIGSGFSNPQALTLDSAGNIYVADDGNSAVKEILKRSGYFINPTLPAGLNLNSNTGIISGTPRAVSPPTNYTVTAYNIAGSGSATLNIKVGPLVRTPVAPPHISYNSPQVYTATLAISSLAPVNTGGAVPSAGPTFLASGYYDLDGVAADTLGNVYFASTHDNQVWVIDATGSGQTLLGSGFKSPTGVAVDKAGDVYVADNGNNAIKEIPANGGPVLTIGSGFNAPYGIAVDVSGNLYVTEAANNLVKKVPVGGGSPVIIGNGFNYPSAVAVDGAGNVYVADHGNRAIKKILAAGGNTVTLARTESDPISIAVDGFGNVYFTLLNRVDLMEIPAGGTGPVVFYANLKKAAGLATDVAGNLYYTDNGDFGEDTNGSIVAIIHTLGSYAVTPALPHGLTLNTRTGVLSGAPGPASPATNYTITAYNAGGSSTATLNIKVNPLTPPQISYTSPQPYIVSSAISPLSPVSSGPPVPSQVLVNINHTNLNGAGALAMDASGNIYVTEYGAGRVQEIPVDGTGEFVVASGFNKPRGVAIDKAGNLYVADYGNNAVEKIPAGGGTAITLGSGFNGPYGVAVDTTGNVYVSDNGNNVIKKIPAGSNTPVTIAAGFNNPTGIALDAAGNIYVTDQGSNTIKEVAAGTGTVITFAAASGSPNAVTVDAAGNLYFIGITNHSLTRIPAGGGAATTFINHLGNGTGVVVDPYGYAFMAFGGVNVMKVEIGGYYITPTLPAGLSMDINTGVISGTPSLVSPATAYNITAYNPAGSSTATVNITIDGSAALQSLVLSSGPLSPVFAAATTNYTATVNNDVASVTVTPTTRYNTATLTVNGTAATSGHATAIPLAYGSNTITIAVTGQNGVDHRTYTITVTRLQSNDDNLAGLSISSGTLTPAFQSATTSYTASVAGSVSSVTLTPTTEQAAATVTVNGVAVTSGTASGAIALNSGSNGINTVVTAQNGVSTRTYTVTVTRANSSDASLANFAISSGTLTPAFATGTTTYSASVTNPTASMTVTPTATDASSAITVNGNTVTSGSASPSLPLVAGNNTITTVVTSPDGTTTKTYTLTVLRPSANANLSALHLSSGTLSPTFAGVGTTSYTASVAKTVSSITVTPTTAQTTSTVKVNGTAVTSGTPSGGIALHSGSNVISAVVTAQDGVDTKTYTVTVTRANSADAGLANFTISAGTLAPAFATGTTTYSATVTNPTAFMTVTPTASDASAGITVNGNAVTSGSASPSLPLVAGNNTITTVVTSPDGSTTKTYTLTVLRPSANANLSALHLSKGTLSPTFAGVGTTSYTASVANTVTSITVTPTTAQTTSTVKVNGTAVTSGTASPAIALSVGANTINAVVTAQDGTDTKTYTVTVTRAGPVNIPDESLSVEQPLANPQIAGDGIAVHQGLSPNGDGMNDHLVIDGIANYPDNKLAIMNRNGALVFESKGYNNNSKVFDGHSNKTGKMQLPGTYFYSLEYTVKGLIKRKTGFIVLKY